MFLERGNEYMYVCLNKMINYTSQQYSQSTFVYDNREVKIVYCPIKLVVGIESYYELGNVFWSLCYTCEVETNISNTS